jgi:LPXTG-motif cell wall-anchored protein
LVGPGSGAGYEEFLAQDAAGAGTAVRGLGAGAGGDRLAAVALPRLGLPAELLPAEHRVVLGDNFRGQLGVGSTEDQRDTPTRIAGGVAFRMISGGFNHTCGVDVFSHGWCWGSDTDGQLGNGSAGASDVPSPVAGSLRTVGADALPVTGADATGYLAAALALLAAGAALVRIGRRRRLTAQH